MLICPCSNEIDMIHCKNVGCEKKSGMVLLINYFLSLYLNMYVWYSIEHFLYYTKAQGSKIIRLFLLFYQKMRKK